MKVQSNQVEDLMSRLMESGSQSQTPSSEASVSYNGVAQSCMQQTNQSTDARTLNASADSIENPSEKKPKKETTTTDDSSTADDSTLMLNLLQSNVIPPQPVPVPVTTTSSPDQQLQKIMQVATTDTAAKVASATEQLSAPIIKPDVSQIPTDGQLPAVKAALDKMLDTKSSALPSDLAKLLNDNAAPAVQNDLVKLVNDVKTPAAQLLDAGKAPTPTVQPDMATLLVQKGNAAPEIQIDKLAKEHAVAARPQAAPATINPAQPVSDVMSSVLTASTQVKPEMLKAATQDQSSQYVQSLNQLGNLIGNQISHHLATPEQPVTTTTLVEKTTNTAAYVAMQEMSHEARVELAMPTIDAFMKDTYEAKIKISPPELGQVTAKLKVSSDGADLIIMTATAQVKAIVENNLPQLRQHFQQADINLLNIDVQTSMSDAEQPQQQQSQAEKFTPEAQNNTFKAQNAAPVVAKRLNAIVDTYA